MKNLNRAKIFIFILGLILIAAAFVSPMFIDNSPARLNTEFSSPLPENVHIPININTADKETLCILPGIGEIKAERIIAYREQFGNFKTTEDITNVYGIGEITYENLRLYVCVK